VLDGGVPGRAGPAQEAWAGVMLLDTGPPRVARLAQEACPGLVRRVKSTSGSLGW
jgi:hypothetical protein